ncbi:MAG: PAS domain-containing protein [Reyranellaceae bacterium]
MQQFVLRQNILRFQARLAHETDAATRRTIGHLLVQAEREFAVLSSARAGVDAPRRPADRTALADYLAFFRRELAGGDRLLLVLDPGPGLVILEVSDAYLRATLTSRADLCDRPLFEVFPDNPDDPDADGVANLYASLRTAAETRRPHEMPVQRYDVRDADGHFVERHWRPLNSPVLDDDDGVIALLHQVEDVSAYAPRGRARPRDG